MLITVAGKHRRFQLSLLVFAHDNTVRNNMGYWSDTNDRSGSKTDVLVQKNSSVVGYENPCSSVKTYSILAVLNATAPTPSSKMVENAHQSTPLQQSLAAVCNEEQLRLSPVILHGVLECITFAVGKAAPASFQHRLWRTHVPRLMGNKKHSKRQTEKKLPLTTSDINPRRALGEAL